MQLSQLNSEQSFISKDARRPSDRDSMQFRVVEVLMYLLTLLLSYMRGEEGKRGRGEKGKRGRREEEKKRRREEKDKRRGSTQMEEYKERRAVYQ